MQRFAPYLSPQQIAQSNALFGYEGDKYYFDVDIRKHFGLDKYTSDVIPYWKTETVEAMDAFRLKPGYGKAAGECVSLAALYAAAAFIVGGIPLEDIYMILTPLHSQNFLDLQDGILTNNRRLVTKSMWFNGTEISDKAQRALRNERVTVVAHNTGYIHCLYRDATINPKAYAHFRTRLAEYLSTELSFTVFASFLRAVPRYQKYFQICRECHGQPHFMPAEMLYHYEHGSPYKIGDSTHEKLLAEVSEEDFVPYELPGRVRCDQLCEFLTRRQPDVREAAGREALRKVLAGTIPEVDQLLADLVDFVQIEAQVPDSDKEFADAGVLQISVDQSREEIIEYLRRVRGRNAVVDLAFYAFRDMESCAWEPFVKAAIERSPVSLEKTKSLSLAEIYDWLNRMPGASIYEGNRLAQPDELANYGTGDGLEKAYLLANVLRHRNPEQALHLEVDERTILPAGSSGLRIRLRQDAPGPGGHRAGWQNHDGKQACRAGIKPDSGFGIPSLRTSVSPVAWLGSFAFEAQRDNRTTVSPCPRWGRCASRRRRRCRRPR